MTRRFPDGFVWGAATAGHQVEGDNTNSDTWFVEHVTPTVFSEPSGRACNSWELWRDDLDLCVAMGLNAYRFSVEWARVEPEEGVFSDEALARYAEMVDGCLERGLAPYVTFNHFTSPHWFAAKGSWLDPGAAALFARYCDRVMQSFGDRIAGAVTLNEPNLAPLLAWILPEFVHDLQRATLEAASAAAGVPRYRLSNVVQTSELDDMVAGLAAGHRAGREAIKARRPELPVGVSIAIVDDRVYGDDPTIRDRKRAQVYQVWLDLARDDDFVGVQNYESAYYDATGQVSATGEASDGALFSGSDPTALEGAVRYAYEATGRPVLVTENGIETADDCERAAFVPAALAGLLDAVDEGVPVLGYFHWSLMDNYEWIFGYAKHLGLHEVDRETFIRTPKPSAGVYSTIVRAHGLTDAT